MEYYFLKKRDEIFSFDIAIECYVETGDWASRRFKEDESVRLFYIKDKDRFEGRFLHERLELIFSSQMTPSGLIRNRSDNGYRHIDAKTYARYKKAILSRYQKQVTQEYERAKRKK